MLTDTIVSYLETRLDSYLAELNEVVSKDSFSYDKEDVNTVVDWLARRLEKLGCAIERFPQTTTGDNLRAVLSGNGSKRIMLLGHSDTVFPRGTTTARPLTTQGEKILGPGTCDMKAGLLTGIYAVEALQAAGFRDYGSVTFLIVADEEIDERHSIPLIKSSSREADVVFTLEAARENGDIVVARKGVRSFTAEAFGHAAHSGVEPEKGRNANLAMAHKIIALQNLNDYNSGISVNVGVMQGGRLRNVVPDYAAIRFEARAYTQDTLNAVTNDILKIFEKEIVRGVKFKVEYEQKSPPMPRTEQIARLEALTVQAAHELGLEVKGARTGGVADAAFAASEGTPVLDGLGPIGGLDHGPDEYILKSSIVPRTALLAKLIQATVQSL